MLLVQIAELHSSLLLHTHKEEIVYVDLIYII